MANDEPAKSEPAAAELPGHTTRIVKVEDVQGAILLTIAAGSDEGVDQEWHACVVDDDGYCTNSGELMIVRVDKTTLTAKTYLEMPQVQAHPMARVWAP